MSESPNLPPPIQPLSGFNPVPPDEARARTWNMLCHLSALAMLLGIPFGNILGPLIVWQIKKNEIPSVDIHGKAAVNFQITLTIAVLVAAFAGVIMSVICVGYLLIFAAGIMGLGGIILAVIAGIKANNGESYKYPFSLELIK